MEWDGHLGPATARSRSLHRSARPRSASPWRHTYYAGASPAPTKASSLYAPTASSAARQRYADQAEASYPQRPLYGTAAAVQGRYRDGAYETTHHTPQVVGYQEVPVYEQLVHREVRVRTVDLQPGVGKQSKKTLLDIFERYREGYMTLFDTI